MLLKNNSPFWFGEAEVAKKYFTSGMRTEYRDRRWLGYQMFKEWTGSGVYGEEGVWVDKLLMRAAEKVGNLGDPPRLAEMEELVGELAFAFDEFRHAKDLARAYYLVAPEAKATFHELGELKNGRMLTSLRYQLRKQPIGRAAVELSEGGGLGLYFGIRNVFAKTTPTDTLERYILGIGKNTLEDEMGHMATRVKNVLDADYSFAQWAELDSSLQEICWQKLLERNEQFDFPYSVEELSGKIKDVVGAQEFVTHELGFLLDRIGISRCEYLAESKKMTR